VLRIATRYDKLAANAPASFSSHQYDRGSEQMSARPNIAATWKTTSVGQSSNPLLPMFSLAWLVDRTSHWRKGGLTNFPFWIFLARLTYRGGDRIKNTIRRIAPYAGIRAQCLLWLYCKDLRRIASWCTKDAIAFRKGIVGEGFLIGSLFGLNHIPYECFGWGRYVGD
jgi:hypothetical protein